MNNSEKRFKITYCGTWGYKQHAVRLAALLEDKLSETTHLEKSSGGVFEIEDRGQLIFSKKAEHRFPEDNEIITLVIALDEGKSLTEAQAMAKENIRKPPTFIQWLIDKRRRS